MGLRKNEELDPDQRKAIMRMVRENQIALFGDLGVGKTAIALFTATRLLKSRQIKRVLVISTIRCIYSTWIQESETWEYTKKLRFTKLHGPDKKSRFRSKAHIHLINYEGLTWLAGEIRSHIARTGNFPYDMLVVDESTKLKDPKTKRFKSWKMLFRHFKRAYILTATPMPNHMMNLWSQFYILDQGKALEAAYGRFQMTYFTNVRPYIWAPKRGCEDIIKNRIAPKVIRIKRPRRDFTYNQIKVDFGPNLRESYSTFEEAFFLQFEEGEVEAFNMVSLSIKLRQFVQGAMYYTENEIRKVKEIHTLKLDALSELVDLCDGRPLLCPIQFRFELEMIKKRFKFHIPVIAGGTSPTDGDKILRDWNKGKLKMVLCHPQSMSHGLNLQYGGHMICWVGLTWSLEQYDQLIGRINRRGQTEQVIVHAITIPNTTDDAVMSALRTKDKNQATLLHELHEYWRKKKDER